MRKRVLRILRWTAGIVSVVAVLLVVAGWLLFAPPNGRSVNAVDTDAPLIALTFDDGPNPPDTDAILELLDEHGVRATFFMTGEHIAAYPDTARQVAAAGHQLGNHSWDDEVLAFKSEEQIRDAIARTDALIREVGYDGAIPFRAPRGVQFVRLAAILRDQGRPHVGGLVIAGDFVESATPQQMVDRVLDAVEPGSIVIFHDGDDSKPSADRSRTVEALRQLLPALRDIGLTPVPVRELVDER